MSTCAASAFERYFSSIFVKFSSCIHVIIYTQAHTGKMGVCMCVSVCACMFVCVCVCVVCARTCVYINDGRILPWMTGYPFHLVFSSSWPQHLSTRCRQPVKEEDHQIKNFKLPNTPVNKYSRIHMNFFFLVQRKDAHLSFQVNLFLACLHLEHLLYLLLCAVGNTVDVVLL